MKRRVQQDTTSPFIVVNHAVYRAYEDNVPAAQALVGQVVPLEISASRSLKSLAFLQPTGAPHATVLAWTSERK